jgi:hypothetical protein
MHKINNTTLLISALCVVWASLTACTTATLITGMSTAPSGVSYASGLGSKVRSYQIVRYENTVEAAQRAADTLTLENQEKDIQEGRAHLRYMDEKEVVIDILIERHTATLTFIQVDVGFFGPTGMSRLMLLQILDEIDEAGDFLEKWTIKDPG